MDILILIEVEYYYFHDESVDCFTWLRSMYIVYDTTMRILTIVTSMYMNTCIESIHESMHWKQLIRVVKLVKNN